MKKLLSILGAVGMTATAGATVVACGNGETLNKYEKVFKDTIEVELGSFTNDVDLPPDGNGGNQNQWGQNSIGALFASLWVINTTNESYPFANAKVKELLDSLKTEEKQSITRRDTDGNEDTGKNVKVNGKAVPTPDGKDWHEYIVKKDDVIAFTVEVIEYTTDEDDKPTTEKFSATITFKIVEAAPDA